MSTPTLNIYLFEGPICTDFNKTYLPCHSSLIVDIISKEIVNYVTKDDIFIITLHRRHLKISLSGKCYCKVNNLYTKATINICRIEIRLSPHVSYIIYQFQIRANIFQTFRHQDLFCFLEPDKKNQCQLWIHIDTSLKNFRKIFAPKQPTIPMTTFAKLSGKLLNYLEKTEEHARQIMEATPSTFIHPKYFQVNKEIS
jgi:hypothetical protein